MDKFTTNSVIHQIPAGLMIGDKSTELFGCRETKRVFALSNGQTIKFEELHPTKRALIFEKLLSDEVAVQDLKDLPQAEAIERLASDKPDKQIADELGITESTLNTHKKHLFEKFNVYSKSGLITKAISNKIIQ